MTGQAKPPTEPLRSPVVIAAFEGWNDAGEAAIATIDHLRDLWDAQPLECLDPEDYHDFQVNRPQVTIGETGQRHITWQTTRIYWARLDESDRDVILIRGLEPSFKWQTYCREVFGILDQHSPHMLVTLGAMMADVPHTRPLPVSCTSSNDDVRTRLGLEESSYEGPTGIVGVLQDTARHRGLEGLSLWVASPHYVNQGPSPKASLALLDKVEDVLDIAIPLGDLPQMARGWERAVSAIAEGDSDISEYVEQLEEDRDDKDALPAVDGDAIAEDFERYLRRRGDGKPPRGEGKPPRGDGSQPPGDGLPPQGD